MDSIEYTNRRNHIFELVKKGKYQEAAREAGEIEWEIVQNVETIEKISQIYGKCRQYEESLRLLQIILERNPEDIHILKKISVLSAGMGQTKQAWAYYKKYCSQEKSRAARLVLKYRIQKAEKAELEERIRTLKEILGIRYVSRWAYELAGSYALAGRQQECLEECIRIREKLEADTYTEKAEELYRKLKAALEPEQEEEPEPEEEPEEAEAEEEPETAEDTAKEEEPEENTVAAEVSEEDAEEEEAREPEPEEDDDTQTRLTEVEADMATEASVRSMEEQLAGLSRKYAKEEKRRQRDAVSIADIETRLRQI